ncbi:lecithin retinol acyltransferase family protein [Thiothrix winogradskyi]|uniref:Lecithin retinol acyltransferase family protein n=1 Tax=Thiothrix winogradskyi TaxID=96472 RepID=A0ABY3SW78_9GAMM|nr:lecithin retinol acyltransferase family protein [Thiothrix winogradskyi]UJS23683.1 lecithin retinol acyltransferase family protein [Thiothrix winogradskyi]
MSVPQPSIKLEILEKPNIGDHLISSRLGYTHHGIYIGNGKVIHYSGLADGLTLTSGVIEEATLEAFHNGRGYSVKTYANPHFTGLVVAQRAKSRLGEDQYNVFSNNCEHFCEWCINDEHHSEQIKQAKTASTKGLMAFTLLRTIVPPQVSIPLSLCYGAYCLLQKNQNPQG